mmetsp:Transcript_26763/g.25632  ORF Transcript_26763/g.25632 Transcript_26763/m.25632 type:complete len:329 (+) Transcript_26763:168-1154(+)
MSTKWIALFALILQNSGLAILMRYTMIFVPVGSEHYLSSTAVLTAEVMKLLISLVLCFIIDSNMSYRSFLTLIHSEFIGNRGDWIKLMVPSILYTLQNSLQYFSMSRLSAPIFQVLYQLKIVTTAVFSVTLLSRRITGLQWLSVVMLTGGVAMVQLSQSSTSGSKEVKADSLAGVVSVLLGCLTSGFAGVYFEMVLKSSKASIWIRNIQLSIIGIFMSMAACYARDYTELLKRGSLFVGYDKYVWGVITLQAAGGLIVAIVVKYADNVIKGFATSISILISCMFSSYLFNDIDMNNAFTTGAAVVLISVFAFGYKPPNLPNNSKVLST